MGRKERNPRAYIIYAISMLPSRQGDCAGMTGWPRHIMSISQDERERAVFRSRRMYQTDLQSDLVTAEDRGRAEEILAALQNLMDSMGLTMN